MSRGRPGGGCCTTCRVPGSTGRPGSARRSRLACLLAMPECFAGWSAPSSPGHGSAPFGDARIVTGRPRLALRQSRSAPPPPGVTRRPPVGEDGISTALGGLPVDQAPSLASSSISFTRSFGAATPTTSACGSVISSTPRPARCAPSSSTPPDVRHLLHRLPALRDLVSELGQRGVTVAITRAAHLVHHGLQARRNPETARPRPPGPLR
jgi:hypothetical protein